MKSKRAYREIKKELDVIMQSFEASAHDDVDEMLADYKKATNLVKELESYLENAVIEVKKHKTL